MFNQEKTKAIHDWMLQSDDATKMRLSLNWNIPHSIFNVACMYHDSADLQEIDWYEIYKSRDLGKFLNGNKVIV